MNIKKMLFTSVLGLGLVLPFADTSSAASTLMAEDHKSKAIPNWSHPVKGSLFIFKSDTNRISAYGQTFLEGFFDGTAPVDSLYIRVAAQVQGTSVPAASKTAYLGQNSPNVSVDLGPNDGAVIYSATGSHNAKKGGTTYSTSDTSVRW